MALFKREKINVEIKALKKTALFIVNKNKSN